MAISFRAAGFHTGCVVHAPTLGQAGATTQEDVDFGNLAAQKGNNQILPRKRRDDVDSWCK